MRPRLLVAASSAVVLAGAVLLAAGGARGAGPHAPRTVDVDIRYSRFEPAVLEVAEGATVTFRIRNHDPIDHEFLLGDQAAQDGHELGTEAHHGTKPGEVTVPGGATALTTYTFSEPGTILLGCHLPGHWDYGMRGEVSVTPTSA